MSQAKRLQGISWARCDFLSPSAPMMPCTHDTYCDGRAATRDEQHRVDERREAPVLARPGRDRWLPQHTRGTRVATRVADAVERFSLRKVELTQLLLSLPISARPGGAAGPEAGGGRPLALRAPPARSPPRRRAETVRGHTTPPPWRAAARPYRSRGGVCCDELRIHVNARPPP